MRLSLALLLTVSMAVSADDWDDDADSSPSGTESVPASANEPTTPEPAAEKPKTKPPQPATVSKAAAAPAPTAGRPGSAGDRLQYVGFQTLFSTYAYGLSFPLAYDVREWRTLVAAPLIAAPLAFGTHLWISRRFEFLESHRKGAVNLSLLSLYAATALPIAFSGDWREGWQIGSIAGAVAYPLGIWYGYHLGDVHAQNPGRLDSKLQYALGYGFLGFITPALFYHDLDDKRREILRVGLGQSVGMAAVGHFLADFAPGPSAGGGVPLGIATHALLGGLLGFEIALLAEASEIRPWMGAGILGTAAGFTEGVFFFHGSRDSRERSLFGLLGAGGGALMGAGVQLLFDSGESDHGKLVAWSSHVLAGAFTGYTLTYLLTRGMTDAEKRGAADADGEASPETGKGWAFHPVPVYEPVASRGEMAWRWRVPGLSLRF